MFDRFYEVIFWIIAAVCLAVAMLAGGFLILGIVVLIIACWRHVSIVDGIVAGCIISATIVWNSDAAMPETFGMQLLVFGAILAGIAIAVYFIMRAGRISFWALGIAGTLIFPWFILDWFIPALEVEITARQSALISVICIAGMFALHYKEFRKRRKEKIEKKFKSGMERPVEVAVSFADPDFEVPEEEIVQTENHGQD